MIGSANGRAKAPGHGQEVMPGRLLLWEGRSAIDGLDDLLAEPVRQDLDYQDDYERADDDRAHGAVGEDLVGLEEEKADAAGADEAEDGRGAEVDVEHVHRVADEGRGGREDHRGDGLLQLGRAGREHRL